MSETADKKKFINESGLESIRSFKAIAEDKMVVAKLAASEAKAANTEYQNAVLRTFIEYNMKLSDHFDEKTGEITRSEDDESTESETTEGTE